MRLKAEESDLVEFKSEEQLKKERSDELREAEKFMVIGEGNATCSSCGYNYESANGDPDFPILPGTKFQDTPDDYRCPLCGAPKEKFRSSAKTIAGFAVNQGYGFGTNTWTGGQKQLLIFGSLVFFFALFISGYLLD